MKNKKCPYCGRRISYFTVFHVKNRGLYRCTRCKKESKIKTDFRLVLSFLVVCLLVIMFMIFWNTSGFYNSFWGVVIVALLLALFYFATPLFVSFIPLKKYKNDIKRHIQTSAEEELPGESEDRDYVFNRDVFEKAKNNRIHPAKEETAENKADNLTDNIEAEPMVPVIRDVSKAHASFDAPLQKKRHPFPVYEERNIYSTQEEEIKEYTPKKKKPDGSMYTANRKL